MRRGLLACVLIPVVAISTSSTLAAGLKFSSIYVVSGTVQSSKSTGNAVCLTVGATVGGGAFLAEIPPPGFATHDAILLDRSADNPLMTITYAAPQSLPATGKMNYILPPVTTELSGSFSMSVLGGTGRSRSFTLEIVTGSLGSGSGSCDMVIAFDAKRGIPKAIENLLSQ